MIEPMIAVSQVEMSKNSSSGCAPKMSSREEATQERTDDTDDRRHDVAARVASGHDRLRDQASEQTEDDECDDAHDRPFCSNDDLIVP